MLLFTSRPQHKGLDISCTWTVNAGKEIWEGIFWSYTTTQVKYIMICTSTGKESGYIRVCNGLHPEQLLVGVLNVVIYGMYRCPVSGDCHLLMFHCNHYNNIIRGKKRGNSKQWLSEVSCGPPEDSERSFWFNLRWLFPESVISSYLFLKYRPTKNWHLQ